MKGINLSYDPPIIALLSTVAFGGALETDFSEKTRLVSISILLTFNIRFIIAQADVESPESHVNNPLLLLSPPID